MPVKVDLLANGRIVEIHSDGIVSRREIGWATERVRELVRAHDVTGILANSRTVEVALSATLSSEIFENFLLAMDQPLPIAYIRPIAWTDEFETHVRAEMIEEPTNTEVFQERNLALDWLERQFTTG